MMKTETRQALGRLEEAAIAAYAKAVAIVNESKANDPDMRSRHVLHQIECDLAAAVDKVRSAMRSE